MLLNYLKISVRNLLRSKSFSAINILGLSVGMTCCMLLLLYIRSELSFDRHHRFAENLYLLGSRSTIGQNTGQERPTASAPYGPALKAEFPEVAQMTRLYSPDEKLLLQVRQPGKPLQSFYETKGYQVDSTFFDLFTYPFVAGNPKTALNDPHSVVLSADVARKLFGEKAALGRLVRIGGELGGEDYKVTGVYRDSNAESHLDARFFLPLSAGEIGQFLREGRVDFANNNMFFTYLRLQPGRGTEAPSASAQRVETKLPAFIEKYARADLKAVGFDQQLFLVPVPDLHLYPAFQAVVTPTNSILYLYISGVDCPVYAAHCLHQFHEPLHGPLGKRAAEVGVRKVMGAERGALVRQFLGESMVLAFLAL